MSTTPELYSRVEFITDVGFGSVIGAFVDFSSAAVSFGVPKNVRIFEGTPEDKSDNHAISEFHRVSVHADGRVETHWPVPISNLPPELEAFDQYRPPLGQWSAPSSWSFDLDWSPEYLKFMKPWFAKPKPSSPTHSSCLKIEVNFDADAVRSNVWICIARPDADVSELAATMPLRGQFWCLTGGWPWVLVAMSNTENPGTEVLSTVGRDYRSS